MSKGKDQVMMKILQENMEFSSALESMGKETRHSNISMIISMFQKAVTELEVSLRNGFLDNKFTNIPDIKLHSGDIENEVNLESMQSVLRFLSGNLSLLCEHALEFSRDAGNPSLVEKYCTGMDYLRKRADHIYTDLVEDNL